MVALTSSTGRVDYQIAEMLDWYFGEPQVSCGVAIRSKLAQYLKMA